MKTAVLFRCHNQSPATMKHLQELKDTGLHVHVIYDSTLRPEFTGAYNFTNDDVRNNPYQNATEQQLDKLPNFSRDFISPNIYFNVEQLVMMWYKMNDNHKYDYVWSIEYDVEFRGNWQYFFYLMGKDESDFLGTYLMKYPEFHFYDDYWNTYQTNVPNEHKYTSYGIIHRYSRDLLNFADIDCSNGFHGYYEQVMPTIASMHGLTLKDINQVAKEQQKKELYNGLTCGGILHNYLNTPEAIKLYENYLFHPVR